MTSSIIVSIPLGAFLIPYGLIGILYGIPMFLLKPPLTSSPRKDFFTPNDIFCQQIVNIPNILPKGRSVALEMPIRAPHCFILGPLLFTTYSHTSLLWALLEPTKIKLHSHDSWSSYFFMFTLIRSPILFDTFGCNFFLKVSCFTATFSYMMLLILLFRRWNCLANTQVLLLMNS